MTNGKPTLVLGIETTCDETAAAVVERGSDGSGRILIPPSLREYAGLSRAAMLIGQGNRFELWDETQWNQSCQQWLKADESAEPLPPELESLSL